MRKKNQTKVWLLSINLTDNELTYVSEGLMVHTLNSQQPSNCNDELQIDLIESSSN